MIDKININQIQDRFDGSSQDKQGRAKPVTNGQPDATLQIDFGRLIEQAVNMPPADSDAVQKAKELLQSGGLDNPANIKEAANNIVKFGI